jgi:uncharacterized protein YjiS (DUF1127 family)
MTHSITYVSIQRARTVYFHDYLRAKGKGVLATLEGWRQRARQRRALADLDAHLLRDIGVSAQQAKHEASKVFWR